MTKSGLEGIYFDQSTDELIDKAGDSYVDEMSDDCDYDVTKNGKIIGRLRNG